MARFVAEPVAEPVAELDTIRLPKEISLSHSI